MNEMQKIDIVNTEMTVREYNGKRVVTFDDICAVHKCVKKQLTKHFERKKEHFIFGEDYYIITRKELGDLTSPNSKLVGNPNLKTYLFTESGYLMVIKCLDDNLAWQVQRALVNTYFRAKSEPPKLDIDLSEPSRKPFRTSTTPVPRNPKWFQRNYRRMVRICKAAGAGRSTLYHDILTFLGEEFNLDEARRIYQEELGEPPQYALDIVSYFPELANKADQMLDILEKKLC